MEAESIYNEAFYLLGEGTGQRQHYRRGSLDAPMFDLETHQQGDYTIYWLWSNSHISRFNLVWPTGRMTVWQDRDGKYHVAGSDLSVIEARLRWF